MDQKKDQQKALSDQQKSESLDKLYQKLHEESKSLLPSRPSEGIARTTSKEDPSKVKDQAHLDLERFIGEHRAKTIDLFNLLVSDYVKDLKKKTDELESTERELKGNKLAQDELRVSIQQRDKQIEELLAESRENDTRIENQENQTSSAQVPKTRQDQAALIKSLNEQLAQKNAEIK